MNLWICNTQYITECQSNFSPTRIDKFINYYQYNKKKRMPNIIVMINSQSFYFNSISKFIDFYQSATFFKNNYISNYFIHLFKLKKDFLLAFNLENIAANQILKIFYQSQLNNKYVCSYRNYRNKARNDFESSHKIIFKQNNAYNSSLIEIFEHFQKSINLKKILSSKSVKNTQLHIISILNSNKNQIKSIGYHLVDRKRNNSKSHKIYYFRKIDNQFDINNKLKNQFMFISMINDSKPFLDNKNSYQFLICTRKVLQNYQLYKIIVPKELRFTKNQIKKLYQESIKKIDQFIKDQNIKYIEKVYFTKDCLKDLLLEVNLFVLRHSSFKSDLKQNWFNLSPKFSKINKYLAKDDQQYQLIIQSFQNIKKYNHSSTKFTSDQKKSLALNFNSVIKSIDIFFNFISNEKSTNQSKRIEKNLFNIIFNPTIDESYRTNVFSVYQKHDDIIYSQNSFYSLCSSTGSGKTRCAPFFFAIKTIQDGMNRPFFIMTQPRYSIIKTKINDFRSIFGKSIRIVTNIKRMLSYYEKYFRKDVDFHPKFIKPIFGLFTAQSLLEMMKEAEKMDFDIYSITRFCLDEIHERTVETDVLCAILSNKAKELIDQNRNFPLQLLLMSATPDSRVFNCFEEIVQLKLPESSLFPVKTIRHEVSNKEKVNSVAVYQTLKLIEQMGNNQIEKGHILIFTSGNSRMKRIHYNLIDKIERKCSSNLCAVKVISDFDSLFDEENIDQFYINLNTYIEHETKKFNFFKNKDQSIMFVLPIKYLGYLSNEQKEICINPIPQHPNLIKVIMATNAIESSVTIDNLTVVVDSGLYNHSTFNRQNGLTNLNEELISVQSQIQRKGRVGRIKPGISVKISLKNQKLPELLPPAICTSDVSLNILLLRKIGYRIEEIENLPNKVDSLNDYISELASFNALTNDTHELTPLGLTLTKFTIISPFISAAILSIAGYKDEDYQNIKTLNVEDENIPLKDQLVLLGCFISLIFNSSENIVINKYSSKLREFFDKRSDIITLVKTILDLAQFTKREIKDKEEEYGLDIRIVIKLLGQLQQTAESFLFSDKKEEENEKQNRMETNQKEIKKKKENLVWKIIFKTLKILVDDLITDDFLFVFIHMLIEQIGKNKPEWIESRKVRFIDIDTTSYEPVFIYEGDQSLCFNPNDTNSYVNITMRPGGIGLDFPATGFILNITHDNNNKFNYGYLIHSYDDDERFNFIPHPISVKSSILLNNDFASPLLDAYFWNDINDFQLFCGVLFYRSSEVYYDSDNKECSLISFIPLNEEAIEKFNNAAKIIEQLLPYTASTILIQNKELKCVVSLHGNGKERIDSSVHFFENDNYFPYQINKETIDYLHENINELRIGNKTLLIAVTGESYSYPLDKSIEKFNKIANPHTKIQASSVFNNDKSLNSHLVMISVNKIEDFVEKNYLMPWTSQEEEEYDDKKKEKEIIRKANNIDKETIEFKHSFNRIIFSYSQSILQAKGRAPSSYGINDIPRYLGPVERIFYLCALNHIQGESLISPLQFRGFYYRGRPFGYFEEINQIRNCLFTYLGNSCVTFDVRDKSQENNIINEFYQIMNSHEFYDVENECIPVYCVTIKHKVNSNLTKEEFIERVDSVLDQFGGIIAKKHDYIEFDSKLSGYQGMIKVMMYWIEFSIPLAGMIKKALQQSQIDPFVTILNDTIDPILFNDRKVQDTLSNWFIENNIQFDQDKLQLIGDEENVHQALLKFKKEPPEIPFKSYPIPYKYNILQVNNKIKYINRSYFTKWYLNKSTRTLYVPLNVQENDVKNFLNQFENISNKPSENDNENDILWELCLHDEEPILSRKFINIFRENGELIQKNYCVECMHESLLYNLRKMYNEEDDCCSFDEIYNDCRYIQGFQFIDDESKERIPLGQMIWSFIKEPKIANQTRTWMTALAIRGLRKSRKIAYCPLHHHILLQNTPGFSVHCTVPSCNFYFCVECQEWHQIGKCDKEQSLPPGSRTCPFCKETVEKSDACNHIHCNCGKDFCYYCGEGFESSKDCYDHMNKEGHWNEAPDYLRFVKKSVVKNEVLKEFYDKYPKWKPKWMDDENLDDDNDNDDIEYE